MVRSEAWLFVPVFLFLAVFFAYHLKNFLRRGEFAGKSVLITGGSRGLGFLLADEFRRAGARVAVCARDREELARVALPEDVLRVACDVTKPPDVAAMVDEVSGLLGGIDVLVNNAGVIQVGPMETMTAEDYREAMDVHYWGPLHATLAVLPAMRRRHYGRIVNIASIGGKISVPHLLPYSGSKFALVGLSEGLRAEVAKDGIRVTTVCPGLMRTGSPRNAFFKGRNESEYAWFSISDSLPLLSMDARRAAKQIVLAAKRGDAQILLTLSAKIGARFHGLFPGLTADLLAFVNRFLPPPGGIGTNRARGADSESDLSPSWMTALSDRAAERNNETVRP